MMSAALQFLLVLAAMIICLATIVWGISAESSQIPPAPQASALVAGGRNFHRVPMANTHRLRGRHRAR
ncbi:hypothetical protein ABZ319_24960 [Nocardia sp. NPDC005978]|uniref:hypothetical protein n=1 Tax=Nocardia sp. NPDC005978 TaxID=3156725 RepID=UPI00339F0C3A